MQNICYKHTEAENALVRDQALDVCMRGRVYGKPTFRPIAVG